MRGFRWIVGIVGIVVPALGQAEPYGAEHACVDKMDEAFPSTDILSPSSTLRAARQPGSGAANGETVYVVTIERSTPEGGLRSSHKCIVDTASGKVKSVQ